MQMRKWRLGQSAPTAGSPLAGLQHHLRVVAASPMAGAVAGLGVHDREGYLRAGFPVEVQTTWPGS